MSQTLLLRGVVQSRECLSESNMHCSCIRTLLFMISVLSSLFSSHAGSRRADTARSAARGARTNTCRRKTFCGMEHEENRTLNGGNENGQRMIDFILANGADDAARRVAVKAITGA